MTLAFDGLHLHGRTGSVRVGLDGRCFAGEDHKAGVYRYVSELCRALDELLPEARFFVYLQRPLGHDPGLSDRWVWRVEPVPFWRRVKGPVWLKLRAHRFVAQDRPHVFWASGTLCPHLSSQTKSVVTVYDLNHKLVPETMPLGRLWSHRLFFARDVLRADAVAAISLGTAARLKQLLGREASAVVRCAVSPHFRRADQGSVKKCLEKYGVERPYLLSVATREPRKNLGLLLETFLSMKGEGLLREHRLVLAGAQGWKDRRITSVLKRSRASEILAIGYVPDDDLPALYSGADAFVFPSIYEGFGLPVLEARACGTPIVATDIPEIREAGGEDAVYVQPTADGVRSGILAALATKNYRPANGGISWTWRDSGRTMADLVVSLAVGLPAGRAVNVGLE
jgi:glycosyltransferase involved in cell wall biosynthesis